MQDGPLLNYHNTRHVDNERTERQVRQERENGRERTGDLGAPKRYLQTECVAITKQDSPDWGYCSGFLLMPNFFNRLRSVLGFNPRCFAAPNGPSILHSHAFKACWIWARSKSFN